MNDSLLNIKDVITITSTSSIKQTNWELKPRCQMENKNEEKKLQ